MVTLHAVTWEVLESRGYETAWVEFGDGSLRARGRAVGVVPEPYWISYELETGAGFVTRRLVVTVSPYGSGVRCSWVSADHWPWTWLSRYSPSLGRTQVAESARTTVTASSSAVPVWRRTR